MEALAADVRVISASLPLGYTLIWLLSLLSLTFISSRLSSDPMEGLEILTNYTSNLTMEEDNSYSRLSPLSSHDNRTDTQLPFVEHFETDGYRRVILGYLLPSTILLTTILNIFVIAVLRKPGMRNSVNVVLIGIAVSDSLTGLTALPYYIYFHTIGISANTHIPFHWCYVQKFCSGILPTVFHTVSVWLTLSLAIHRYIYLCHSLQAKTVCTISRMARVCVATTILGFILHSPRLYDSSFVSVTVRSNLVGQSEELTETCVEVLQDWAEENKAIYFPIYYWIRLVTVHLVPTVGLLLLNGILIAVIRSTNRRRRRLILQNRSSEWRRVRQTNSSTILLVAVISIFLLVEVPMAVFMLITVIQLQYRFHLMNLDDETQQLLSTIFNFVILLSYPINFFIYVSMSKRFRSHISKYLPTRRYSKLDTDKITGHTGFTTRDKTSSVEMIRSVVTVTALPLATDNSRELSASIISNLSNNSSTSNSTKPSSVITVRTAPAENIQTKEKLTNVSAASPECTCTCSICMTKCHNSKLPVTVETYTNDIVIEHI